MKKILLLIALLPFLASAQYDSTRVWQPISGDGFIWKNGQFNGALIFPIDTPHIKSTQRAISFKGATPYYWTGTKWNSFGGAGGVGTMTSLTSGNASPLFTTNVSDPTGAASLTFTVSPSSAYTVYGNSTGSAAAPTFFNPVLASNLFQNQGTTTQVLHGNAAGAPTWGSVSAADLNLTAVQSVRISGSNILTLDNDQLAPDTFTVYGTDSTAARGWQPSQPSRLTNPQDNDGIFIQNISGRPFLVNHPAPPASTCIIFDEGWYPQVIDLDSLSYYVTESHFVVTTTGQHYIIPGGIVTLPVGTADPGEFRLDLVGVGPSGPSSLQGTNSTGGEGSTPDITDPCAFYPLVQVQINADEEVPATENASTNRAVYLEHAGPPTEATMSTFGTITVNFDQTTNSPPQGTKSFNITSAANNAGVRATFADTLLSSDYSSLNGRFRTNTNLNTSTNFLVRLRFGTLVSNTVQITARGVAKTGQNNVWQYFSFNISDFPGFTRFTAIDFVRVGTGTINVFFDNVYLQKLGATVPGGGGSTNLTWQQTLDYGSTLNKINTVNQSGFDLTFQGGNIYSAATSGAKTFRLYSPDGTSGKIQAETGVTFRIIGGNDLQLQAADGSGFVDITPNSGRVAVFWTSSGNSQLGSISIENPGDGIYSWDLQPQGVAGMRIRNIPNDASPDSVITIGSDGFIHRTAVADIGGGGGGGTDSPDRIDGTATANVVADMDGNALSIINGNTQVSINATASGFSNSDIGGFGFDVGDDIIYILDNRGTPRGIEYVGDYSAGYTSRSLIDFGSAKQLIHDSIQDNAVPFNFDSPAEGQIISYDATAGEWVNIDFPGATSTADSIRELPSNPGTGNVYINTATHRLRYKDTGAGFWYEVAITDSFAVNPLTDIVFNSTSGSVVESPTGTWTYGASARSSSTSQVLSGDGYVKWEIGDQAGLVVGLDQTSGLEAYTGFDYAVFFAGGTIYAEYSGSNTSYGSSTGITNLRIKRTGSTVILEKSTDNEGSWSTVHTYGATFSGDLYVKAENVGAGAQYIVDPKGSGF